MKKLVILKKRFTNIINDINNNTYIEKVDISLYNILKDYIDNKYKTGIISARSYKRNTETLKLLEKCCKSFIYKPIQKVTVQEVRNTLPNFVELKIISSKTKEISHNTYSQNVIDKFIYFINKRV